MSKHSSMNDIEKYLDTIPLSVSIVFGNSVDMSELEDESVHLIVTSPPYYNAPFDTPDMFKDYSEFLSLIEGVSKEMFRVLDTGRIACVVVDDTLVSGDKYPVVADVTRILKDTGFRYRDKIIWVKPEGYIRISRRSGVLLQHPYPMYFYPDNLQETILIFQKGKFDYRSVHDSIKRQSIIDLKRYQEDKWYLNVWRITNVLPVHGRPEEGIAAFPEEIPERLIRLFSYNRETVLDPFAGSGTTIRAALRLGRNAAGYEINLGLRSVIEGKISTVSTGKIKVNVTVRGDSLS